MVEIASFKRNAVAMRDGDWVAPLAEFPTFEIKTKAMGYAYADAQAAKVKRAARQFGGEDRIPTAERARINTEALTEKCLLDVRGLTSGGQPIDFAAFCLLIQDDGFGELSNAAFGAAFAVGRDRAADIEDAAGNSAPVSVLP